MIKLGWVFVCILLVICFISVVLLLVIVDEVEGLCIVMECKVCNLGWEDIVVFIIMVFWDMWGKEFECVLCVYMLEWVDEGDKFLIVFDLLVDVKGVVFFSFLNILMFDD